jgi:pectate lyase
MRRPVALRLGAALGTAAIGGAIAVALPNPSASAAVGTATGYASANGGTTGGNGGQTVRATTGTQIHQALCSRASSSTPITIEVSGTINHGNTAKVSGDSCNTADGVIELKQISNVTIIGVGGGAVFDQLGIHIRDSSNIIIQNVTVRNVKKSGSPTSNGGDAIGMESTVRNVWVDHVTLEASGGESEGFDGLFDMKNDVEYVTLSYSILRNSGRGGLIGSSESDTGSGFITFNNNKYENIDSRTPLLRGGIAHIYNNHYVNLHESGINSRAGARAKVENNYFKDS